MREALNLDTLGALTTLLPYDHRIDKLGKLLNIRPEPYIFFMDHEEVSFHISANVYSRHNAWWMSEMAFLAYEDGKVVELLLKNLGMEGKFFKSLFWDGEAFIAYDDEKIFLAYRGTEPTNLRDWLTDFRFNKVKTSSDNTIHSGFKKHFDELEKDFRIGSVLSILLNGKRKLYITGHSLGGALAIYASYYYMHHIPVVKAHELQIYTYGAPKIGDEKFAKMFSGVPTFRIVHKNDIIPRLPPLSKYLPVGHLHYINIQGKVVQMDELPDFTFNWNDKGHVPLWKKLMILRLSDWKDYASMALDHSPVYYSIRLKEEAQLADVKELVDA